MPGVDLDLNHIPIQTPIQSVAHEENYEDIKNAVNNLQFQLDGSLTPPVGSEVPNARDYHSVLRDRLRSASQTIGNRIVSGLAVGEQGTPNMTVHVTAGEAAVAGVAVAPAAGDSPVVTAPGSNTRLDYIVVNSSNGVEIIQGVPSATPIFPTVAASQCVVGCLVVKSTTTALRDGYEIFRLRAKAPWHPDVYVNANTTLTADLNYNNLIVDGCRFDTAGYTAYCQGYAHLSQVANGGLSTGAQVNSVRTDSGWIDASNYAVYNFGADVLQAGTLGKVGSSTYYKAGSGNNGYVLKIKAFAIYVWGTCDFKGTVGLNGTNNNVLSMPTELGSGEDGGDGGDAGGIYLEAIKEIINSGTVDAAGASGGNGKNCSAGTQVNLGGQAGKGGDGAGVVLKAKAITAGTVNYGVGATGSPGVGSGGAVANGNGSSPTGASGSLTQVLWNGQFAYPADYASWMRAIEE